MKSLFYFFFIPEGVTITVWQKAGGSVSSAVSNPSGLRDLSSPAGRDCSRQQASTTRIGSMMEWDPNKDGEMKSQ